MYVEIHIPAIRVEEIETNTNSQTTIETRDETTVVIQRDVSGNPNFDYYLQPKADLMWDYFGHTGEFAYGGMKFNRTSEPTSLKFECYPDELREAAKKAASEDFCHEVQILAEWTWLAEGRYPDLAEYLQKALDDASDDNPDAEYSKEYNGGADPCVDTTDGSLGDEEKDVSLSNDAVDNPSGFTEQA
jgi:hypothetical protein